MSSSILTSYGHSGYSAEVKMHLLLDEQIHSIGQLGPDFLVLHKPIDHPPANARLFFSVDGKEREWDIRLPEGISADARRVVIANAE
jgi:hypothetical protein